MKWTAGRIVLVVLQFLCFFVVPIVFVWLQYSENTTLSQGYKWTVTGLIVAALIVVMAKKIFLNNALNKLNIKIANMETTALVTTDEKAIKTLMTSYKISVTVQTLISIIVPACVFAIALLTCKALEAQAIKLFGVLSISATSFGLGLVLKIIEILTTKSKHEVTK